MLSSPRRPSSTMRIFSSAEYCLRVARRMSWTTFSAGSFDDRVCCLIFAPVNVTMSQKLSLLQSANSVSWALMADNQHAQHVHEFSKLSHLTLPGPGTILYDRPCLSHAAPRRQSGASGRQRHRTVVPI